jgi:hypothetical protein
MLMQRLSWRCTHGRLYENNAHMSALPGLFRYFIEALLATTEYEVFFNLMVGEARRLQISQAAARASGAK